MLCIDHDAAGTELLGEFQCGDAVAEEQLPGLLVVDEIDGGVALRDDAGVQRKREPRAVSMTSRVSSCSRSAASRLICQ